MSAIERMIVRFARRHLSIQQFAEFTLPDFTVLTGVNGSGKTHLLQAIKEKAATVANAEVNSIVSFSYETFRLENESPFNAYEIEQEKTNAYNFFDVNIRQHLKNIKEVISKDLTAIQETARSIGIPYWDTPNSDPMKSYRQQVLQIFDQPHVKQQDLSAALLSFVKSYPTTIEEITREEFERSYKPFLYKSDFLPQMIGRVIWDYNVRLTQNELNVFRNAKQGLNLPCLSEENFFAEYGEKPWVIINEILKQFDTLEYEINSPEGGDIFSRYHLQLVNINDPSLMIDFDSLSSGEKILMALVASVYKSASDNHFPDLLLLDELDATLHPSMMKNLLEVISNVFVSRGTKVILVTHSPSTIAFAPEDSIFVVNKKGFQRVEKRSKKEALAILTEGYATLDEGMLLFDQVVGGKCSIITEGRNTRLLADALRHFSVDGVSIVDGLENMTGKDQLKTLFNFMCKVPHEQKVIFIWDCDVNFKMTGENNTYPIIMERNHENTIAKTGIENMFQEKLFDGFVKKTILANKREKIQFDETCKRDFEVHVLNRREPSDFINFKALAEEIKSIRDRQ